MDLDQRVRDLDDPHPPRDRAAGAKREVDAVDARHIPARKHGLLDAGPLLRGQVDVARLPLSLVLLGLVLLSLTLIALWRLPLGRLRLVARGLRLPLITLALTGGL